MTRLHLHIGQPKTATTSIQTFLAANRAALIGEGWLYPEAARQYAAHHLLANFFRKPPYDWIAEADPGATRAALLAEIDATGCADVILSTEALYGVEDIAAVARYFEGFDTRVVIFLRRQDEWLESAYQEQLKNGATRLGPADYAAAMDRALDYRARVEAWAAIFGAEAIRVSVFEPAADRQPVEATFMAALGAPFGADLTVPPGKNERLNRDCIAYLSQMKTRRRLGPEFARIKAVLGAWSRENPDPPARKYALPPTARAELLAARAADNAHLARTYLGRGDGVLFAAPPPDPEAPWEPYGGLTTARAVEIGEYLALKLAAQAARPGPRRRAARRRAAQSRARAR